MSIHVFGIRHHGPGSARSLQLALDKLQPDIILVEGPADIEDMVKQVATPDLKPPVAILVYNPKDLSQASYYPFAEFSPEWIAMQYAIQHHIHLWHMDLPSGIQFNLGPDDHIRQAEHDTSDLDIARDPLGHMAQLAGYTDGERWWEVTFEQHEGAEDTFDAVLQLMSTLRETLALPESRETLLREAFMRETIRKAKNEMYQRIAIVCGAWHGPVLDRIDDFKAKADKDLLKGLKKDKVQATWIPWTYERISRLSGYGAGVLSPAWYELLFKEREHAVQSWMIQAARLFRAEDLDASSAHVIEAVRLAEALAALRGLSIAGMNELADASLSIFCGGHEAPMALIHKNLLVGDKIGQVPPALGMIPLQADMEAIAKRIRLNLLETKKVDLELDIRKDNDKAKSHFLHRANLLGIPLAKTSRAYNTRGTFKESWTYQWFPDFALNIIEAGMWGSTMLMATENKVKDAARRAENLGKLAELLHMALLAGLPDVVESLCEHLRESVSLSRDVQQLMDTIWPLVQMYHYGDVRNTDKSTLYSIIKELVPRICIGLPQACHGISEEAAEPLFQSCLQVNRSIALLKNDAFSTQWGLTLQAMADNPKTQAMIAGLASRLCFDAQLNNMDSTATRLSRALSAGQNSTEAASWLEGFLHGSGQVLIHYPELWQVIDTWLGELPMDIFQETLPLLRRTFSRFHGPERQKMLDMARMGLAKFQQKIVLDAHNDERAAQVVPVLQAIFA